MPIWREEFLGTQLSLATDTGGGTWRTKGYEAGGSVREGYRDFAGSSWNTSPVQHPEYNPFTVADSILTITARRNPGLTDVGGAQWLGGYLVSNHLRGLAWRFGYFEWRASFPDQARGMFPALWLFNNVPDRKDGKEGAEIDAFEIFGDETGSPWAGGYHMKPDPGIGRNAGYWDDETRGWHRYGVEWTPDSIAFYRDGLLKKEITGSDARWFRTANLGLRMNYAVDPSWEPAGSRLRSTPADPPSDTELRMLVDYVRVYAAKPVGLPTGTDDPYAVRTLRR
jgi:beta-glucanase (GH16 family)